MMSFEDDDGEDDDDHDDDDDAADDDNDDYADYTDGDDDGDDDDDDDRDHDGADDDIDNDLQGVWKPSRKPPHGTARPECYLEDRPRTVAGVRDPREG